MRQMAVFASILAAVITSPLAVPFAAGQSCDVVVHCQSQSSISFNANQSSFQLTLPDYRQGTTSDAVEISYSLLANDVGRLEDLVVVRLMTEFDGIALEGRMGHFTAHGGTAHLTASSSDFKALSTADLGLANKGADSGNGRMIDGDLTLLYRAKALKDLEAGRHDNTLIVSFVDN